MLDAVIYYTSQKSLKEETNKILAQDKDAFFIRAVHVDRPDADAAHDLLRIKFGKMYKATLTEFTTNQVNTTKIDIKKIINECNGNVFLNLYTDGMTDTHHGPFYALFTPKTYIFCANAIALKTTFGKCCKQFPDANLRMVILPDMKHIEKEYYNYQNSAPISDEYTVNCSDKSKTSDLMAMLEVCDNPSTLLKIKEILSKKIA